jgi:hypothetical protein
MRTGFYKFKKLTDKMSQSSIKSINFAIRNIENEEFDRRYWGF